MAMMDYGAILKIDNVFINKNQGLFMNMQDDCGFVIDCVFDKNDEKQEIDGNYFVYAGDKDFLICFYKAHFIIIKENKIIFDWWGCYWNNDQINKIIFDDTAVNVTKLDEFNNSNRFVAKWICKNKTYEVIFGYGIDPSDWNDYVQRVYKFSQNEINIIDSWFND